MKFFFAIFVVFVTFMFYDLINKEKFEILAILAVLVAGLIPSFTAFYLHKRTLEQEHKNWLLRDKTAYIPDLLDIFTSTMPVSSLVKSKMLRRLIKLRPAILAHGGTNTIRLWNDLMSGSGDYSDEEGIRKIERLFRALRKDLKHDDSDLEPGEITSMMTIPEEKDKVMNACKGEKYDDLV